MQKISIQYGANTLEEYRRLAQLAKDLGATHLSVSQVESAMWLWNQNRYDPYPNWCIDRPSIFRFIVPDALKPYLPQDYADRNLKMLIARAEILKEFGLKATFDGMEPAYLPEQVYRDHPTWRGPRCDQARRARTEYYAPCIDNPEVRAMYVEAVCKLCEVAPFESFNFLTNDSGGGLCWAEGLYPGKNGPMNCANKSIGDRISDFMSMFQEGAALAGCETEVNVYHIDPLDEAAALPKLKKKQAVNNRTMTTSSRSFTIGFSAMRSDHTTPVALLPRMVAYAEKMQKAQDDYESNLVIGVRSINDHDTVAFLRKYFRKMEPGAVGRYKALTDMATEFVGEKYANTLVDVWDLIEKATACFDYLATGGHIFSLGTVHQRWLTRPFVAFPGELTAQEKEYYRPFQFQAQTEEDADNMLDLQAHRWIGGYSGQNLINKTVSQALPYLNQAVSLVEKIRHEAGDIPYQKTLKHIILRLKMYICIIRNANNVCSFQTILDRTDYNEVPVDKTPIIREQGDIRYFKVNQIIRNEIDNTLEMISLLEQAEEPILQVAESEEFESVMIFGPDIINDFKKKIDIMENHRRDFERLYKSYNL